MVCNIILVIGNTNGEYLTFTLARNCTRYFLGNLEVTAFWDRTV